MTQDPNRTASPEDEGGAFGDVGEVTWTTGFGSEDLAGAAASAASAAAAGSPVSPPTAATQSAPVRPAQPAPIAQRPVQPRTAAPQAPVRQPVAAPQAPVRQPVAQRPVGPQRPVAPAPQAPAPAPQAPAPQAPAPAPASTPAVTPSQPAPDLEAPPWATISRANDDASDDREPAWASTDGTDPETDGSNVFGPVATTPSRPAPAPVEPDETPAPARRGRPTKGKPAKAHAAKSTAKRNMAGGRWKVTAIRTLVIGFLVVMCLGGIVNVIRGKQTVDVNALTQQVAGALGQNGFPNEAADAFAIRFTKTYLTFDPNSTQQRTAALAAFSQDAATGGWLNPGPGASQSVISGPVIAGRTELTDAHNGVVTVGAQVSSGAWVYLAIPIYSDGNNGFVVSGPPAFVSPPAGTKSPNVPPKTQTDDALNTELQQQVLPGFFTAWAASNSTELTRYITKDATPAVKTGLGGTVTLAQIVAVQMDVTGGAIRQGTVKVLWQAAGVGTYAQTYRLTMYAQSNGLWSVGDILGGDVEESTSSTGQVLPPANTSN